MRFLSPRVFCGTAAFAASLASVPASAQPVPPLQDLGTLGGTYSVATAISADGAAVAGHANITGNSGTHAFRWTAAGGMQDLGTLGGTYSEAQAISADGAAVAGYAYLDGNSGHHAFRWTAAGGMQDLDTFGGTYSVATAISADGAAVAGYAYLDGNSTYHAFRWTGAGGMQDLGTFGGTYSVATAISADGAAVAGHANITGNSGTHAFLWTGAGSMQDLGTLGGTYSYASAISADGAAVAGYAYLAGNSSQHAFRWTDAGGMQDLGTFGGTYSYAYAISADGAAVAGYADLDGNSSHHAFRWTDAGGMQDLGTLGGNDSVATAISADGSVVAGWARNASGYDRAFIWRGQMLDLVNTQTAMVQTAADLAAAGAQQLGAIGGLANAEIGAPGSELTVHGSSMGTMPARLPVALRLGAAVIAGDAPGTQRFAELGAAVGLGPRFTLGGSLALGNGSSNLESIAFDGRLTSAALYLRSRAPEGRGLTWKLAAAWGGGTVDVLRPNLLPNTEAGHGLADLQSRALLAEIGWDKPTTGGRITPYLRLAHASTTRGGYTEAGDIDFPVTYAQQQLDLTTATLGLAGEHRLSARDLLRYDVGAEIDLSRSAGQIIATSDAGDFAFDAPAAANTARLAAAIGVSHRVGANGTLTADLGVAQSAYGGRPATTLRLGYEMRF